MTRDSRPTLSILVFGSILFVSSQASAVYQCDGEKDDCQCGKDNPFPCCSNGGNCTWWAWESACCAWGAPALPTYGDAWHWAIEAQAAGWPVRSTPKVGTVFVRTIGGGDCGGHDCGHVGWVISVDSNGGFCATEMACWGWYGVRTNCHSAGYADGGFICKKGMPCEDPAPTCSTEVTSGGETVIDDLNPCFTRYGTPAYWWEASIGYAGHMWYTYATDDPTDNYGVWTLKVRDAQNYEVYAYIPENNATTHQAKYRIHHNGKDDWVTINQNDISAQFVSLGTYDFSAGGDQYIRLDDSTGEDYNTYKRKVGFDAVKLVPRPSCIPNCSGKQCGDDGCGGSCGSCPGGWVCQGGKCVCVPNCAGKQCGSDGCGGSCGSCNDGNPCTDDWCSGGVCVFTPNSAPCDDGDPCTTGDVCAGGSCQGTPISCDDGNPCTNDACNPATGCSHVWTPGCCTRDEDCNDSEACTIDLCVNMVCVNSPSNLHADKVCQDGNLYWVDSCGHTGELAVSCPCGCSGRDCRKGDCSGRECGDDGCGGSCGECPDKMVCVKDETMSTASCVPCVDCESLDSGVEVYDSATGESSMEPDSLGDLASLSDFPTEFPATRETAGTLETLPAEQMPDQDASLPEISQSGGKGGGCAALGMQDAGTCPLWLFVLVLGFLRSLPRAVSLRVTSRRCAVFRSRKKRGG